MDYSNLTINRATAQPVVKPAEVSETSKPAPDGNFLPVSGQVLAGSEAPQLSAEKLRGLVDRANKSLLINSSNLKFSVAEGTNINVVRVEDTETGELIRQIPSETMIAIARAFDEIKQGAIIEERA